jgi:hypothetical protein
VAGQTAAERLKSDLPIAAGSLTASAMNHLRKLGLASFFFLGLGVVSGAIPVRSDGTWQPATMIALICYCIALVLALIAFMQSRRGQSLDGTTKFIARAPLALVTIGVLILFLRAMTGL